MSEIQEIRKRLPKELQKNPERKKGCLLPPGTAGKGDADSRCTSHSNRRERLSAIFGEKCPDCRNNTKKRGSDGRYHCIACNTRFMPL